MSQEQIRALFVDLPNYDSEPVAFEFQRWDVPPGLGMSCALVVWEHFAEFRIYEIIGGNDGSPPLYQKSGESSSPVFEKDVAKAQVFCQGSIKWDGCVNFQFPEQEDCMLHCCGRQDAMKIGVMFDRLYDAVSRLIPAWDAKCAE